MLCRVRGRLQIRIPQTDSAADSGEWSHRNDIRISDALVIVQRDFASAKALATAICQSTACCCKEVSITVVTNFGDDEASWDCATEWIFMREVIQCK